MKNILFIGLAAVFLLMVLASNTEEKNLSVIQVNGKEIIQCDLTKLGEDTVNIPLSEWVENCEIVCFENSDTALFKFWWSHITNHYIGIRPRVGNFKLFSRKGRFLCDVGQVGNGAGEYAGTLYSAVIDEIRETVYLASFFDCSKILKYDLKGRFIGEINLCENLNKPTLMLYPDGGISLIHLYMNGVNTILGADIKGDTICTFAPDKSSLVYDSGCSFNDEIWCFNNLPEMKVMFTFSDTLYNYNKSRKVLESEFCLKTNPDDRYIICPLPGKYVISSVSGKEIVVDTKQEKAYYFKLVNDYYGGLTMSASYFSNGWFWAMYEPLELIEEITNRLKNRDLNNDDRIVLKKLLASLDVNGNNVMFLGKIRK